MENELRRINHRGHREHREQPWNYGSRRIRGRKNEKEAPFSILRSSVAVLRALCVLCGLIKRR
jgi:hypothetical protein